MTRSDEKQDKIDRMSLVLGAQTTYFTAIGLGFVLLGLASTVNGVPYWYKGAAMFLIFFAIIVMFILYSEKKGEIDKIFNDIGLDPEHKTENISEKNKNKSRTLEYFTLIILFLTVTLVFYGAYPMWKEGNFWWALVSVISAIVVTSVAGYFGHLMKKE